MEYSMKQDLEIIKLVIFFLQMYRVHHGTIFTKGIELIEYFLFKELHRPFFCIDIECLLR